MHLHIPASQKRVGPGTWRQRCECGLTRDVSGALAGHWINRGPTEATKRHVRAVVLLRAIEWAGRTHDGIPCCPKCNAIAPPTSDDASVHFEGCELDALAWR